MVGGAIGLQNNGAICYFNSLLQCLLACPSFNEMVIQEAKSHPENALLQSYKQLYLESRDPKKTRSQLSPTMVRQLVEMRRRLGHTMNLGLGTQEAAHDGLTYLVDLFPRIFETLFAVRYRKYSHCKCEYTTRQVDDPHFIVLPVIDQTPILVGAVNTR